MRERQCEYGYSILELVVTLLIVSLLTFTAIPVLSELYESSLRTAGKEALEQTLLHAKAETLRIGARGILTVSTDGSVLAFGADYLPVNDPSADDSVIFFTDMPSNVTVHVSAPIIFSSQGYLSTDGGDYTQLTYTLSFKGKPFCEGIIYALGTAEHRC